MEIKEFEIEGLILIQPRIFKDDRGYFFESFNTERYANELGFQTGFFVQDNLSVSKKNVLRGLHFQNPPNAQGKLVSVLKGSVLDVAVDLRKNSKTYGMHQTVLLNAENHEQFYIPPGFAHGFLALEDQTLFSYKCTANYTPQSERTLLWNDKDLAINWNCEQPIISEKDAVGESFTTFVSPF